MHQTAAVRQTRARRRISCPTEWALPAAPVLYVPGCATRAPGPRARRRTGRRRIRVTGQFLGPNSTLAIGTLVPGLGQPDQRPVPRRPGHRRHDLHVPGARRRAAVRHGLRPDRQPEDRAARRRRAVLRPAVRQLRHLHGRATRRRRRIVTVRYGQLQSLGSGGLTTQGAAGARTRIEYEPASCRRPRSGTAACRCCCRGRSTLDVEYVGQHSFNTVRTVEHQRRRLRRGVPAAEPGPDAGGERDAGRRRAYQTDLLRAYPRLRRRSTMQHVRRLAHVPLAPALVQPPVPERPVVRLQRHHRAVRHGSSAGARLQHNAGRQRSSSAPTRPRPTSCSATTRRRRTSCKANFVWDLPDLKSTRRRRDGHWRCSSTTGSCRASGPAQTGAAYTVSYSYQNGGGNVNLTGSPDYRAAHPRRRRSRASGCSSDPLSAVQHRRVRGAAEQQRRARVGQRLPARLLQSVLDLAIARNIRLGGAATSSCASTCSTPSTRRASRTVTRACRWRVRQIQSRRSICRRIRPAPCYRTGFDPIKPGSVL